MKDWAIKHKRSSRSRRHNWSVSYSMKNLAMNHKYSTRAKRQTLSLPNAGTSGNVRGISGLWIQDLMADIKYLSSRNEFDKIQIMLAERECYVKKEMENLEKSRASLERAHGLAELQKLELESKLELSLSGSDELKEQIKNLNEKNKNISDLTEEISNLDNQMLEKAAGMDREIEILEHENLMASETIEELKSQLLACEQKVVKLSVRMPGASDIIEKLRYQLINAKAENSRSNETIREMKHNESKLYKAIGELKNQNMELSRNIEELRGQAFESFSFPQLPLLENFADIEVINVDDESSLDVPAYKSTSTTIWGKRRNHSEISTYTNSQVSDIFASLSSQNLSKTWMCEVEMLNAFQDDIELCMNAVCVLYRQKLSANEPPLFHFNAMGGNELAEYLIDGDQCNRLKKTVYEVRRQQPEVLVQCRRIALAYCDKLYCYGEDQFFK